MLRTPHSPPVSRFFWHHLAGLLGCCSLLGACSTGNFMQEYLSFDHKNLAEDTPYCQNVKRMTAKDLYGDWTLELTQTRQQGEMRLSQHPEFSDSLRAHVQYGPLKAIASGDVKDGNFDLDESSDGKRLTATWSGSLPAGDCGRVIRGVWTELDTQLKSSFVLRRVSPATPQPQTAQPKNTAQPAAAAAVPPANAVPAMAPKNSNGQAPQAQRADDLPIGVQVMPVPDPGFN